MKNNNFPQLSSAHRHLGMTSSPTPQAGFSKLWSEPHVQKGSDFLQHKIPMWLNVMPVECGCQVSLNVGVSALRLCPTYKSFSWDENCGIILVIIFENLAYLIFLVSYKSQSILLLFRNISWSHTIYVVLPFRQCEGWDYYFHNAKSLIHNAP